ncbi:YkgJ family cysteine cluster protein [Marinicrinis lubricantis]|uniref:YkgJ family cysteine cluster protein n=1 Tax=Marinicrinis lubricantis TaxID=2086470 RepID=A0ABW1INH8_9BACL
MECRPGCGACCIVISISSPIPGMPGGKPAGVPCIQLTPDLKCKLFGKPERPKVCSSLHASPDMCGATDEDAYQILSYMEDATRPIAAAEEESAADQSN